MKFSRRQIATAILRPLLSLIPSKEGPTVLTFHNILPRDYLWFDNFIEFLQKSYEFIDPLNFETEASNFDKTKILLTFDDGFLSNKYLAEEILSKHDIKAIFFVTEDFIELEGSEISRFVHKNFYPDSEKFDFERNLLEPMNWADVKWLSEEGHMIGAHTKTHPKLSLLNDEAALIEEIIESANRIQETVDTQVNCFAFPFGTLESVNKKIIEIARTRFDFIFSNLRGNVIESPGNQFIFRQNIVPNDPLWLSKLVIGGKLDWLHSKSRKLAKNNYTF